MARGKGQKDVWEQWQIDILFEMYPVSTREKLEKTLPMFSYRQITNKAATMCLTKTKETLSAIFRKMHKEHPRVYVKTYDTSLSWVQRNPERAKEIGRRWRDNNKDKKRAIGKLYYARHREEILLKAKIRKERKRELDRRETADRGCKD